MMTVQSPKSLVLKFFNNTATSYDKVALWATFGKDRIWKKEIVNQINFGKSFLDLACGTGILTRKIADKFPESKIIGVDITKSYLAMAKKKSSIYKNISFVHQDAELLHLDMKFDCIASSYIPKYCDPKILVRKCLDHLNPRGKIILHDFTYPKSRIVRIFWNLHFLVLGIIGFFFPTWKEAFLKLPNLIKSNSWLTDYEYEMSKNGLDVNYQYLTWNCSAILIGEKNSRDSVKE